MASFWDTVTNVANSNAGKAATSQGYDALGDWLGVDTGDTGSSSGDISIVDEPWFIPAVVGGVIVLVLLLRSR